MVVRQPSKLNIESSILSECSKENMAKSFFTGLNPKLSDPAACSKMGTIAAWQLLRVFGRRPSHMRLLINNTRLALRLFMLYFNRGLSTNEWQGICPFCGGRDIDTAGDAYLRCADCQHGIGWN